MKRALAMIAVLVLAGFVKAPAGWQADVEQAKALATKENALTHFGGATSLATAEVYTTTGAALVVTAIAGKVKEHRDAAARVEVDGFLGAANRAKLANAKISTGKSSTAADSQKKELNVLLQWQDTESKVETEARLVVAGDAENLVAVTGECVFAADATPAVRAACKQALETLDPGIAIDKRLELALAPDGTEPPRPEPPPSMTAGRPPATMTDGTRAPLPPIEVRTETKRTTDRRPVYVGFGIIVLAAVFWWNRRRRERFDAEGPNDDDR